MKQKFKPFLGYSLFWAGFYLPVLAVLGRAFLIKNAWAGFRAFLQSPAFGNTLWFSATEALVSAAGSLLLALPGAYLLGHYDFKGKKLLRSIMALPFMLPGILVVLGMIVFYGENGTVNHGLRLFFPDRQVHFSGLYGFWGIILAHIVYNVTFCVRVLGESWERIDPKLAEASAALGANRLQTWGRLVLPLLMPSVAYLFGLVFLYSFLSFTIVLVLGGYLYKTLEVLIYIEYNTKLNFDTAAMIAAFQSLLLAGTLALQMFFSKQYQRQSGSVKILPRLDRRRRPFQVVGFSFYLLLLLVVVFGPLLVIIFRSFSRFGLPGAEFTLENYRLLFQDGFQFAVGASFGGTLSASLGLAIGVAVITTGGAHLLARWRRASPWSGRDLWLQLPVGISFLTFAFGLLTLAGKILPAWILVIWAQVFLAFPIVYSLVRTARRELGEPLLETAAVLGAGRFQIFRTVEWPLMKKTLATGFSYAMAVSLGDMAAVLTLGRGEVVTLSLATYRLIGHYRFAQAVALGTIFIGMALVLFLLVDSRSGAESGKNPIFSAGERIKSDE
jgi:thiamine transport system permease protein